MTGSDVMMLVIAAIGGASALLVVTARNVVHAALYLVVALLGVAGTFLVVGAEFLAWAQVLVYVGAVVILILFGLMLTRAPIGPMAQHTENRRMALGVSGGLFAFLVVMILGSFGGERLSLEPTTTGAIGEVLYTVWAFPFMVLGFLLTVALIGAIIVARREEGEGPEPEPDPDRARYDQRELTPSDASSTPGVTTPAEERAPAGQRRAN
jgi:NADH-quinone oxidoreductase subunit J